MQDETTQPEGQPDEQSVQPEGIPSEESVGDQTPAEPGSGEPEPPAVEPTPGDQGEDPEAQKAAQQQPAGAAAPGFDPNQPVATSAQPPEAQSGIPSVDEEGRAAADEQADVHAEANETDGEPEDEEEF